MQIAQGPGRESSLTLVFADTQPDNFGAKHRRIDGMLAGIRQRHGIHGNGCVSSRVALVWVSMDGELVKAATERLVSSTGGAAVEDIRQLTPEQGRIISRRRNVTIC